MNREEPNEGLDDLVDTITPSLTNGTAHHVGGDSALPVKPLYRNTWCPIRGASNRHMEMKNVWINSSLQNPNHGWKGGSRKKHSRFRRTDEGSNRTISPLEEFLRGPKCPLDFSFLMDEVLIAFDMEERGGIAEDLRLLKAYENHNIFILKEPSAKFPNARYICCLCHYHIDNSFGCVNHVTQERHQSLTMKRKFELSLRYVNQPSEAHILYLTTLLLSLEAKRGLDQAELQKRETFVKRLYENASRDGFDVRFHLFGSSLTGIGFTDSDLNIAVFLQDSDGKEHQRLCSYLMSYPYISKAKENLGQKVVFLEALIDNGTNANFNSLGSIVPVKLSRIIKILVGIDPRVKHIALALRFFAKACLIDVYDAGTFPPYFFVLMALHFCQHVGILPLVPESVINLNSQNPNADDNFTFTMSLRPLEDVVKSWSPENHDPLGYLWLRFLRFLAIEFDYDKHVFTLLSKVMPKLEGAHWNRKICIEDPLTQSNLTKCIIKAAHFDFILDKFRRGYHYFAVPRNSHGPLYGRITEFFTQPHYYNFLFERQRTRGEMEGKLMGNAFFRTVASLVPHCLKPQLDYVLSAVRDVDELMEKEMEGMKLEKSPRRMVEDVRLMNDGEVECVSFYDAARLHTVLSSCEIFHNFHPANFICKGTKNLILFCKSCGSDGHMRADCPDELIPILQPINPPPKVIIDAITSAFEANFEANQIRPEHRRQRLGVLDDVKMILYSVFREREMDLVMFGSTNNGFGLLNSDVDFCLIHNRNQLINKRWVAENPEEARELLDRIEKALTDSYYTNDIVSIPLAKVPIIKFRHLKTGLEGDISLSNVLGVHNTKLLKAYADIDIRVKILGCGLKRLVKLCDISEASKGSLSSYAFMIMLIHFLQRTSPPVVPNLQKLGDGSSASKLDGMNIYFFRDVLRIGRVWDGQGLNKATVGELWLQFISYYTEVFDFDTYVVSMSQNELLLKRDKMWFGNTIAIEDPFDASHNLGLGLTRRMSVFIIKTLQNLRKFFNGVHPLPQNEKELEAFYFNGMSVSLGVPPIDRQCRLCRRIGHFSKNCTNMRPSAKSTKSETELEKLAQAQAEREMRENGDSYVETENGGNVFVPRIGPGAIWANRKESDESLFGSNSSTGGSSKMCFNLLARRQDSTDAMLAKLETECAEMSDSTEDYSEELYHVRDHNSYGGATQDSEYMTDDDEMIDVEYLSEEDTAEECIPRKCHIDPDSAFNNYEQGSVDEQANIAHMQSLCQSLEIGVKKKNKERSGINKGIDSELEFFHVNDVSTTGEKLTEAKVDNLLKLNPNAVAFEMKNDPLLRQQRPSLLGQQPKGKLMHAEGERLLFRFK